MTLADGEQFYYLNEEFKPIKAVMPYGIGRCKERNLEKVGNCFKTRTKAQQFANIIKFARGRMKFVQKPNRVEFELVRSRDSYAD